MYFLRGYYFVFDNIFDERADYYMIDDTLDVVNLNKIKPIKLIFVYIVHTIRV